MARDADVAAEEPAARNGWRNRAQHWLSARAGAASARAKHALLAAAVAATDACIASLRWLRQRADAAEHPDEPRVYERERRGGNPAVEAPAATKPRRRLRGLLVYFAVMLAGTMVGTALAYDLLERLLDRRSAEVKHQGVKLAKYSKLVTSLERRLEQGQAKQVATEIRLVAASAEHEKKLGELRAKQVEAEARLASALALRASAPQAQRGTGASRDTKRDSRGGWARSGDCTLGGADVRSALSGCIAAMNRK